MKTIATFIALALTLPVSARAATYYVSTTGNDNNNGTSLATPWRNIAKAAATMVAGDTVFIRGGTYRETVSPARSGNNATSRITYSAYNGEQVIVSGANIFTGWTQSGNAWRLPWTVSMPSFPAGDPLTFRREMVIVDGTVLRAVGSLGAVVPGTFFVEGPDNAPTAIYMRTPDNSPPSGHTVECALRHPVFDAGNQGWLRVVGLTFRHAANRAQWAMCTFGREGSIIESNIFEWSNGLGIAQSGRNNTYLYNISRDNGQMGWGGYGTNNLIENCKAFRNNWKGYDPGWEAGGTKFVNTINCTIRKFESGFNEGPGIWLDIDNYGNIIEQCWAYTNRLAGIMIEYKSDLNIIRNCIVHGTRHFAYAAAGILTQAARSNTYVHNTCIANEGPGIYIRGDGRWANGYNKIYNNLLRHNAHSPLYVGGSVGGDMEIEHGNGAHIGNQLNGNIYYHPNVTANSRTFFWSADYFLSDDIVGWRARTGGDQNSIIADPLVQNWQSPSGWHLTAASPARGRGVTPPVPVTVDYEGNPRPSTGADAGADQFTTGNNPPTVSITSPANGATFTTPVNITINATASDSDGTVTKVDFYQGSTLLGTDTTSPYSFTWNNVPAGGYTLTAVATDNGSATTTSSGVGITVNPPAGSGVGLRGEYFDNSNLTTLRVTRTDTTVSFDWGTGSPDPSVGVDTFSVRWTGQVQPQFSQTYTFYTVSDDGARLWVNNQLLIDKWIDQAPTEWSGQIALTANQKYDIRYEYYENGGGAVARLLWSSPSTPKAVIPQSQLFLPPVPNNPPTASITSPANGATFTAPASITIDATASDSDGTVTKVDFYQGTSLLGTDTSSPYSFAWNNVGAGSYALRAVATDNLGATGTSVVVNVTANNPGQTPFGGTAWAIPGQIQAENYDVGGEGVAYHDNDTANQGGQYRTDGVDIKTTADTGGGHSVGWLNANEWLEYTVNVTASGTYTIQARVGTVSAGRTFRIEFNGVDKTGWIGVPVFGTWDTYGTVSVSGVSLSAGTQVMRVLMGPQDFMDFNWINIVAAANNPPTVSLTSPVNGATFAVPANITINANAADSDGSVTNVDFYQGSTKLGSDTTSPYSFAWNNVGAGSYTLTARATDNAGVTTTSAPVNITVTAFTTPVYQVNGGGSAASPYVADAYFVNGTPFANANAINTNGVVNPAPIPVYQSYRYVWGNGNTFTYTFTNLVANTQHKVRLHFADIYNTAANQRKFHVDLNGTRVLTDFDIIATAGAANKATVQEFILNSDGTGRITILFTATTLDSACVNGIQILR